MSAQESIAVQRRRGLLVAMFALAACDTDTTPIVQGTADASGESLNNAPTNGPGGRSGATRDPGYKLGPNDRLRIIVFGQPTLTGEFTIDGLPGGDYVLRAYFNGKVAAGDTPGAHIGDKGGTFELKPDWNIGGGAK